MKAHSIDEQQLISRYNNGETIEQLAKDFGVSTSTVHRRLRKNQAIARTRSTVNVEELIYLYIEQNLSMQAIADKTGLSFTTVQQQLKWAGIQKNQADINKSQKQTNIKRHGTANGHVSTNANCGMYELILTKEFLVEKYIHQKMTAKSISEDVGCSIETVKKYLKKFNIKRRK